MRVGRHHRLVDQRHGGECFDKPRQVCLIEPGIAGEQTFRFLRPLRRAADMEIGSGYHFILLCPAIGTARTRSEEHTSELQSLMRTSYAVFCLKKKIA